MTTAHATPKRTAAPATPKTQLFEVLPHDIDDPSQRWEMHRKGERGHHYFATHREAIAAAIKMAEVKHPAKVVLHAKDGHKYREYHFD
jgi:hypothetical protein